MNAARRKQIDRVVSRLNDIKADLESIQTEEQDAFEAMPESLQAGERGQRSEQASDSIEESLDSIEGALDALQEAIGT